MPSPMTRLFVCNRCRDRATKIGRRISKNVRTYTTTGSESQHPPSVAVKLTNRRLIAVSGSRAGKFLQGLTTNNISEVQQGRWAVYSSFLTAQGRVLNDVFILRDSSDEGIKRSRILIEVDADRADQLLTHLSRHKLDPGIKIGMMEDLSPWHTSEQMGTAAGTSPIWTAHPHPDRAPEDSSHAPLSYVDNRAPGMGRRVLLPSSQTSPDGPSAIGTLDAYTVRRILRGVPEGQQEIIPNAALLQQSNIDFMGGVDFRKGCYVGQELTIRTHHTGVVRKRILPVQLYPLESRAPERLSYDASAVDAALMPPSGATIYRRGDDKKRSAGKFLRGIGNVGLALCRLETMTDFVPGISSGMKDAFSPDHEFQVDWSGEGNDAKTAGCVGVKAFVPDWWPRNINQITPPI